jgi:hypothetical protein
MVNWDLFCPQYSIESVPSSSGCRPVFIGNMAWEVSCKPCLAGSSIAGIGPIMISQMFQRTNLNLPLPAVDPQAHVDYFLHGRMA